MNKTLILPDLTALSAFALRLANGLQPNTLLYLQGELGAGKTTFTQWLLKALGYEGLVKSPTYTLVETYVLSKFVLHHFDLYRLTNPLELYDLGIEDYQTPGAVWIVEWPEKAQGCLPNPTLSCTIKHHLGDSRQWTLETSTLLGQQLLAHL